MKRLVALCSVLSALLLIPPGALAQWESIAPGFEYQKFTVPGPVEAFVVRMVIGTGSSTEAVDSMIAQGQFYKVGLPNGGRETVSGMVARYDDTISYFFEEWGRRNDVIAAINGDYWEREYYPSGPYTGRPESGQVQGGWFCRWYDFFSGGSGFFDTIWGVPHIGGDVSSGTNSDNRQKVIFYEFDGSQANLTGLNVERGADDLILYTPQWAGSTHTDATGVEVLIQVNRPTLPLPHGTSAHSCSGTIIAVRDLQGDTPIPFDHVVLSATGSNATTLRNKCVVGQEVRFQLLIRDYGFASRTPPHPPQDWTKAYGSIGCDREIVIDGQVTNLPSPAWPRDPRTAVAFNANYIYFIVVDGRRPTSIGMDASELANFMINTLGATHGVTEDGGGSSAMWVQGRGIVNVPSDGSERATVNGLMMVRVLPAEYSATFSAGNGVVAISSTPLRLGPGTNYAVLSTAPAGSHGVIVGHNLNGVRATGQNWWKWEFNGTQGWSSEDTLQEVTAVQDWDIYRPDPE